MITPHHKATVHRLIGDSKDIVHYFEMIQNGLDKPEKEDEILFFLRKIVSRCDYISSQIESEIKINNEG